MSDLYILGLLILTGIFIIRAISLNLLLGYTGQLSLGHVASSASAPIPAPLLSRASMSILALVCADVAKPVWLSFLAGGRWRRCSDGLVGCLAFRVRGAYFVILTVSFAQVMRLIALNWVDLTEGPMAINNIPSFTLWLPASA